MDFSAKTSLLAAAMVAGSVPDVSLVAHATDVG